MDFAIPLLSLFVLAVLLKLQSIYTLKSRTKNQPLRLPPGPRQLPLIGSLHHFLLPRSGDLPHHVMKKLSSTYGPLMLIRLGAVPTVVVSGADAIREVAKTHDLAFCSRPLPPTHEIITFGGQDILFSRYNERWRELRKICVLELLNHRRVLHFRPIREAEVERLIQSISSMCTCARPIDIGEMIFHTMNDIIMRTSIGKRSDYQDEILHEFDVIAKLTGGFTLVDLYPSSQLIRWVSPSAWHIARCQRKIHGIIGNIIRERTIVPVAEREDDILGVLLRLQKDGGLEFPLTNEVISSVIFDVFSAGSHTSSTTLEWAISELMKNRRVLHKAQSEVRNTFAGQDMPIITEEKITNLSYIHLVIKETLRLHPPAPVVPRECRETCQILGYDMPKGITVLLNVSATGRDSTYWDNADEFMPERFAGSSISFKGTDFQYIPFGAGRRLCPGITLADVMMGLILANLLYHFDWELPDGVKSEELDMTEAFAVTVRRKSKLFLHAKHHIN